ncbi:MAG: hypothetical protein J6S85_05040 [Methanobrevibacter sp.]|nr:hypothetical protein [Methanobrevibacter sp.]
MVRYAITFTYSSKYGVFHIYRTIIEDQGEKSEIYILNQAFSNFIRYEKLRCPMAPPYSIPENIEVRCIKEVL